MGQIEGDSRTEEQIHEDRLRLLEIISPDYKKTPDPEGLSRQYAEAELLRKVFGEIEEHGVEES